MNFCWPKDQNFKQQTIFHILLCTYLLMVPILVNVASQILVKKICSKIKCFWLQWSKKKPCKILYVLFRVCHAIMQCIMKNVGATSTLLNHQATMSKNSSPGTQSACPGHPGYWFVHQCNVISRSMTHDCANKRHWWLSQVVWPTCRSEQLNLLASLWFNLLCSF